MRPVEDVNNTCDGCGHEWVDKPGEFAECRASGCPECGSLYWKANGDLK